MLAQNRLNANFSASCSTADSSVAEAGKADTLPKVKTASDTVVKDTAKVLLQRRSADSTAAVADTSKAKAVAVADSVKNDTVVKDTAKVSKSVLEQPVEYTASDSVTFEAGMGNANLYGNSKVNYTNLELQADWITMNMDSSLVHAVGRPDSTGKVKNQPVFKQGSDEYEPELISYNFKTRKAFIDNVYTKQGDGYLISEESKRDGEGVMCVRHGKYTTCSAKHPHFYMALTRAKVRPGKDVIFGPAYLVVEDVPLPLAIPYGFFPFSKKYSSGFIMPTFGDEMVRGFYLRDGGYYFAISDMIDLKLIGEIYTKGSWGLNTQSNYRKRYRFSGNFYLSYQNTVEGDKNMPDYAKSTSFKVQWTHRQDAKANPSQSFSASVNFATSNYERNNLTSMYNPANYTQSTRTSSVAYSKTFDRIGLTLSGSFNLSQSVQDSSLSMTLPSLDITLARFYPFKRKKAAGNDRWYEKIALSYTGSLSNSINTKENLLFKSNIIKDWNNGMRHNIPISATFNLFNYINITPQFNFTDRMYSHKIMKHWDDKGQREVNDTIWGFQNVYNYDMSISATTKLYGFYTPLIGKRIQTIRHVFTPTVSFNYAPDFSASRYGYYASYVKTDVDGNVSTVSYSPYSSLLYGAPGSGKTGSISMDVSNNIEMKVRTKNDSLKKISLIDELGANLSYNMAAERQPWSNLSMRVRIKTPWNYTFSMNAVFATYAYEFDENGNVKVGNRTEWSYGRFGRFQGMSQHFSYTFNNDTFKKLFGWGKGRTKAVEQTNGDDTEDNVGDTNIDPDRKASERTGAQNEPKQAEVDEDGYLKFKLPWSFTVSYGVTMSENTGAKIRVKRMRYPYKLTHTLNFSGNIRISDGWNLNYSSGYDFNYHKLSMTTASVSRDLHCFSMSASVVLSPYTSYNFTFSANASELADVLKWKQQSSYSSNIEWY
ncbi:MAG: LPS-assembly protein LptD [Paraprevotella sp.]|nr:LPS-assembly protein LptD [Paraprevotella sp.]